MLKQTKAGCTCRLLCYEDDVVMDKEKPCKDDTCLKNLPCMQSTVATPLEIFFTQNPQ